MEIKTVVVTDVIDSTKLLSILGDERAADVFAQCDRLWRDLLITHGGQEIDRTDGLLALFDRPIDALRYALAGHDALAALSARTGAALAARAGLHLGEVILRHNLPADVARGAKPIEVEGLAKPTAARLASVGMGGQTLLTHAAFDLARRASVGEAVSKKPLQWLAHGAYLFKGLDEPVDVFEVGIVGVAPLTFPPSSEKATRVAHDEATLGWRPAPGQEIPLRPNWIVHDKLGEGGFGEVWLAAHKKTGEQRVFKFCFEVDRLRALRREVTLFRLLKDALGNRDDIARILDWQFEEAPFFLEAEYTDGGNLAEWAERQGGLSQVPLPERLEIVAQLATALGAAHSVGVLHKDVKPANVLMVTDGGRTRARLTDFGIGLIQDRQALLGQAITIDSVTEMVSPSDDSLGGTYLYMAPEVVEGKPATIQADLYAVGVLLYQIVVGDFGRALTSNWDRDIQDELLREDIAALVDGSPERRLGNAAEVADRLRTLDRRRAARLEDQRGREQAAADRLALERAQRRRRQLTIVAAVAGVVVLVVSALGYQAIRARREADFRRGQAEDLISFMVGDLRSKLRPVGRLDVLDDVGKKALAYFAAIPKSAVTDADLMRRSKTLSQIGDVRSEEGKLTEALGLYQESLTIAKDVTSRNPAVAEWQIALGDAYVQVGNVLRRQSDLEGALQHWQSYLTIAKRLVERDPDKAEYQLHVGDAYGNLGTLWEVKGDLKGALHAYRDSLAIIRQVAVRDPENAGHQEDIGVSLQKAAEILQKLGDLRAALKNSEDDLAIRESLAKRDPGHMSWKLDLAKSHRLVGELLQIMGDDDAALTHLGAGRRLSQELIDRDPANVMWRRELAENTKDMAVGFLSLGGQDDSWGRLEMARSFLEEYAAKNPDNATGQFRLASTDAVIGEYRLRRGDSRGAVEAAGSAVAILEAFLRRHPENSDVKPRLSKSLDVFGQALESAGRRTEATAAWTRAGLLVEPVVRGSSDWRVLEARALSLIRLARLQEAEPVVERLLSSGYRESRFLDLSRRKGLRAEHVAGARPGE